MDASMHAIEDPSVNVNSYDACFKMLLSAYDAMYKAFEINKANCFKVFDAADATFFSSKGLVAIKISNITECSRLVFKKAKLCYDTNQLFDSKALNASSNCTKNAFSFCMKEVSSFCCC